MYIGNGNSVMWTDTNRNHVLRQYSKWEYGTADTGWLLASARHTRGKAKPKGKGLARRFLYFVNSFRGFAAFDVRRSNDRDSL